MTLKQSWIKRCLRWPVPFFSSLLVIMLNVSMLYGWWIRPLLDGVSGPYGPATFFSVLAFVTAAMAILPIQRKFPTWRTRFGAITILFAVAALLLPILDFSSLYPKFWTPPIDTAYPAAVPPLLAGMVLCVVSMAGLKRLRAVPQLAVVIIIAWGIWGVSAFLLNIEVLHLNDFGANAFLASVSSLMIGVGLWTLIRESRWHKTHYAGREHEQISFMGAAILGFLVLSTGLASFAMLKQQLQHFLKNDLVLARDNRVLVFENEIKSATLTTREIASRTLLGKGVQAAVYPASNAHARQLLNRILTQALNLPVTGIQVYGRNGALLAQAGRMQARDAFYAPLVSPAETGLFWNRSWILQTRAPIMVDGQAVGQLLAEFPLAAATDMSLHVGNLGATGRLFICEKRSGRNYHCFAPQAPHLVMSHLTLQGDSLRAVRAALRGQTGFNKGVGPDRQEVVNAYAPIGATGLALLVEMDESEFYGPLYTQVQRVFLLFSALALLGMLLLRWQVTPLVRRLAASEQTARQARAQLRTVIEALPLGIFLKDGMGRWLLVNRYGLRLFNLGNAGWQGKTDLELARAHPAAAEALRRCAEDDDHAWALGTRFESLEAIADPAGNIREFQVIKVPLFAADGSRKGLVVVGNDITERKQAEKEIQLLGQYNRNLIEANLDALAVLTCEGRIADVNVAMESMTGLPRHALLNTLLSDYCSDPQRAWHALDAVLKNGMLRDFAMEIRHQSGTVTPVDFNATVFHDENGQVAGAFLAARDVTEKKLAEQKMHHLAYYDALTRLPNRILFKDRLQQALRHAHRQGREVAVMFLDLDRFKLINDSLGHEIGDLVLKAMAERLLSCVRNSDTVARMGGDEFTILLTGLQRGQDTALVARKILEAVSQPLCLQGNELFVGASIGIALYPIDGDNPDLLLKHADMAMYAAKEQGNFYQFYTQDMNFASSERLSLENAMRHAIEANEFVLFYQPQVDLNSGRITGVEALLRWRHPQQGLIPPLKFIPLAEETGLIVPIGEWVLRQACMQNKAWREQGLRPVRMAVNLSARQFRQPDLVERIEGILADTGLTPHDLELELTETIIVQKEEATLTKLFRLKDMGIKISIDDFGTGYSSLNYLRSFPVDKLKIDRSFVQDITQVLEDAALAKTIIAMAHSLNLEVAAEGVETQGQLNFLQANHCCLMQGYYFAQPLPAEECAHLLREEFPVRLQSLP